MFQLYALIVESYYLTLTRGLDDQDSIRYKFADQKYDSISYIGRSHSLGFENKWYYIYQL